MIEQLTEEEIALYAESATTIQEPSGTNFTQGAQVGRTIPAKWWNWLFNAVTKRIRQGREDSQDMLTELQNVVTDTGVALNAQSNVQLRNAVTAKNDAERQRFLQQFKKNMYGRLFHVATMVKWGANNTLETRTLAYALTADEGVYVCCFGNTNVDWGVSFDLEHIIAPMGHVSFSGFIVTKSFVLLSTTTTSISLYTMSDWTTKLYSDMQPVAEISKASNDDYIAWHTIIGGIVYFMTNSGQLFKTDGVHIEDTGLTAVGLNLPTAAQVRAQANSAIDSFFANGASNKVDAIHFNGVYYVGNLAFDGNTWSNVNEIATSNYTAHPLTCVPRILRDNALIFMPYGVTGNSYIIKSNGGRTMSPLAVIAYRLQDQVTDLVMVDVSGKAAYSFDGETCTNLMPEIHLESFTFPTALIVELDTCYIVSNIRFKKDFSSYEMFTRGIKCAIGGTNACIGSGNKITYDEGKTFIDIVSLAQYSEDVETFISARCQAVHKAEKIFFLPKLPWYGPCCFINTPSSNFVTGSTLILR